MNANMIAQQIAHPIHCSRGRSVVAILANTSADMRNPPKMNVRAALGGAASEESAT